MDEQKTEALEAVLTHYGAHIKGNKFMASCPLHEDRTPSMSVNLPKGVWNCMSCSQAGDAITLVERMEDVGFLEAKEFIEALGVEAGATEAEQEFGSVYGGRRTRKTSNKKTSGGYKPSWRR